MPRTERTSCGSIGPLMIDVERVASAHALAFLHVDVHGTRHRILVASAFVGLDDDAAHALDHRTVMHRSLNLGDDSLVARVAGFEQLDDPRQTAGNEGPAPHPTSRKLGSYLSRALQSLHESAGFS